MVNEAKKFKNPRTLAAVVADPRVQTVSDERGSDDGIWADLKNGWCAGYLSGRNCAPNGCVHSVHEDTIKELLENFKTVRPCVCGDGCPNPAIAEVK